ncbi:MAG: PBP1A family penicillin-binding protein [Bacillota bacterium]|nr:PBP1A family penicillin-binding protein [Bacillota bacterium]
MRKKQIILSSLILIIALFFGLSIGALTYIIKDTPDISNYKGASEATLIYSADGQLLTKLYRQNRIVVPLERIPIHLQNAIIAIEDNNFYVHHGIDFWGIARAFVTNIIKQRSRPHGASTITQQLAGNTLLDRQNVSYYRKIQEAYLAMQFERLYTKPEILEMYLNEIFLGHSAYGVQSASLQYFGKNVWELNLSECALIAGLPKGPNLYSPFNNYQASINRRNMVLDRMAELGYISAEEAQKAKEYEIVLREQEPDKEEFAPYFIRYVRDQLIDKFGAQLVYGGGLRVYTTLDPDIQRKAEEAVKNAEKQRYLPSIERNNTNNKLQPQLAIITLDPTTGEIKAMIGGRGNDHFNRTYQAMRQPGSAFKPLVFTTAIRQGWSPASIINDMPISVSGGKNEPLRLWPNNFDNQYFGLVSLRDALKQSLNSASVQLIREVGVIETIKTAEAMGITTLQAADRHQDRYSIALGGLNKGVTPLELASAYGVFANQGILVEPISITRVLDKHNRVIYEAHPEKKVVLSEEEAYLMTSMLQSVVSDAGGTGWRTRLGNQPVAGKTGTANNYTDAWYVGFTPKLVTCIWIGEDNPIPMEYNQKDEKGNYLYPEGSGGLIISSSEAARLWGDYMREVVKDMPISHFKKPATIVSVEVDPITGLLPNDYTVNTVTELFQKGNEPTEKNTLHQPVRTAKICTESGLLATAECPEESIVEYRYFANSRLRIGSARIDFGKQFAEEDRKEEIDINGTYFVDAYEPIQKIDPVTGIPETNELGEILYEIIPEEECDLHGSPKTESFFDSIWDFFYRFYP